MASAKAPVQQADQSPLEGHDGFLEAKIWPAMTDYARAQEMPKAEILVVTFCRIAAELSLQGVPVGDLRALVQCGVEWAREVRDGQH